MAKKSKTADRGQKTSLMVQALLVVVLLAVASHLSLWAWIAALILVSWVVSRHLTEAWWDARKRAFGRELEARSLADLARLTRLFKVRFDANVAVPGLGDADGLIGSHPALLEIKSFRYWNASDKRCLNALAQVARLMERLKLKRAILWLPQGELTVMQRMGLMTGMPSGVVLVAGPAWRPLLRAVFR